MSQWVLLDWIILSLLVIGLFWGYSKGLILQLFQLLGWLLAFIIAYIGYDTVAPLLRTVIPFPQSTDTSAFSYATETFQLENMFYSALAFCLLFFLSRIAISYLARLLHFVSSLPILNMANRVSGAIIGFLTTFVILLILINVLYVMPSSAIHEQLNQSNLVQILAKDTSFIYSIFQKLWKQEIQLF